MSKGILAVTLNPTIDRVCFVESLNVGGVNRPVSISCTAGGKGINVAKVAAILEEKVDAAGFIGGRSGDFIREEVEKLGIGNRFTPIAGETRTCVNITDQSNGQSTEILESGPQISSAECAEFLSEFEKIAGDYDVIVASGSLPPGVPLDFYPQIIQIAHEKGTKIIVDTSGKALSLSIKEQPYMVKPNQDELRELMNETDLAQAVQKLKNDGITMPVVSLGKDGCYAVIGGEVCRFTPPDVPVINTVGSGDSFVAGVAIGICQGLDDVETIKLAMACGVANTQFPQTGMVSAEFVYKFYREIKVHIIQNI